MTTIASTTAPPADTWMHLLLKWWTDNGTLYGQAFANGKSLGSPVSFLDTSAGSYITVAGFSTTGTQNTSGQFDDVQIYNYTLTPDQIKILYNNGSVSFN